MIPYGRHEIDEEDIAAVTRVLRSDYLTTGPEVEAFEQEVAIFTGAKHAVAVSNGTAGLHCAMYAAGIKPGDEVIVPAMTFAATANAVVYVGGRPVFSDVCSKNLLSDPLSVENRITPKTKAIACVDYAGHPCDYDALREVASNNNLQLIADSCHSLGASYKGRTVGSLADMTILSFHPVKHITTGEGGMVLTDSSQQAERIRRFRNHGIDKDAQTRTREQTWFYEIKELGYNYRLTDIQCALGRSQLHKLPGWLNIRRDIARRYDAAFEAINGIRPLDKEVFVNHAYHLYVVRIANGLKKRNQVFSELREKGLGVNVHYIPVHFHPFYIKNYHTGPGMCPVAEEAYEHIISLPIFGAMTEAEISSVISIVEKTVQ